MGDAKRDLADPRMLASRPVLERGMRWLLMAVWTPFWVAHAPIRAFVAVVRRVLLAVVTFTGIVDLKDMRMQEKKLQEARCRLVAAEADLAELRAALEAKTEMAERMTNKYRKARKIIKRLESELLGARGGADVEVRETDFEEDRDDGSGAGPSGQEGAQELGSAPRAPHRAVMRGGAMMREGETERLGSVMQWMTHAAAGGAASLWVPMLRDESSHFAHKIAWSVAIPLYFLYLWGLGSSKPVQDRPILVLLTAGGFATLAGFTICARLLSTLCQSYGTQ